MCVCGGGGQTHGPNHIVKILACPPLNFFNHMLILIQCAKVNTFILRWWCIHSWISKNMFSKEVLDTFSIDKLPIKKTSNFKHFIRNIQNHLILCTMYNISFLCGHGDKNNCTQQEPKTKSFMEHITMKYTLSLKSVLV